MITQRKGTSAFGLAFLLLGLTSPGCVDAEAVTKVIPKPVVTISGGASVRVGDTLALTATTIDGEDSGYAWSSSDTNVATVDADGVVTGVAGGEVVITATGDDSGAAGSWGVFVRADEGPVVTIEGGFSVAVGATLTLTATTAGGTDASHTWTSSAEDVATVDADGVVTGVAVGEALITATGADTGASGQHVVVVLPADDSFGIPFEELWGRSGHADATAEAFTHWDEDGEIPTSCARCHSTPGYQDYLGLDGTPAGVVDNPAPTGSVVTCVACHNDKTLELDSVTFPSGAVVTGLGAEARCMTCHQGRESTTSIDEAIANAQITDDDTPDSDLAFRNIHYFAAGATLFGGIAKGGYQYADKTYDVNNRHAPGFDNCMGCHNPHSLEVRVDACADCHDNVASFADLYDIRMNGSLMDYDGDGDTVEGIYHEIATLRGYLFTAIQTYAADVIGTPIVYADQHPYFFVDTNGNGDVDEGEATSANRYTTFSARLVRATYNYQYSLKDPGAFAHNPKYIIELMHDSINDLQSATSMVVDLSSASRIDAGHFAGDQEPWRHWDADGAVPASCSRCHSAEGLPLYAATGGTIEQPVSNGMACTTCHPESGNFALRVEVDHVTFPSGKVVDSGNNTSNLCMTCHQGRQSTAHVDNRIQGIEPDEVTGSLGFSNVHYFPAGATLYGTEAQGAYEYAGMAYDGRFTHVSTFLDCNSCHDTHKLSIKTDLCTTCHEGVDGLESLADIRMPGSIHDYDGDGDVSEGIWFEIDGLRQRLYEAIRAYSREVNEVGIAYDGHAYPYFFLDPNDNGVHEQGEGGYNMWSPRLLKAAYNYQYAQKDPGAFAHNAKYVIEFLYDSIADLGQSVTVDLSGLTRNDGDHFDTTAEAWRHWDAEGEVQAACARCHSPTGFELYITTGEAPAEPQPLSYGLRCESCHTGSNFVAGAPLREPASVTFPSGVTIANPGGDPSFLCMQCHQGRESAASIDAAIAGNQLSFKNIHYLSAGASLYGADAHVGYQYEGKTYAAKWNHYEQAPGPASQCNFCHEVTAERHAFEPRLAPTCVSCHNEATSLEEVRKNRTLDYDGDGDTAEPLRDEVAGLAELLYQAMRTAARDNGTPLAYLGGSYPYFFKDPNDNGVVDQNELGNANRFNAWTPALLKASHNFQISQKEPGGWAHNTHYTVQLLIDAIEDLGGDVSGLARP